MEIILLHFNCPSFLKNPRNAGGRMDYNSDISNEIPCCTFSLNLAVSNNEKMNLSFDYVNANAFLTITVVHF